MGPVGRFFPDRLGPNGRLWAKYALLNSMQKSQNLSCALIPHGFLVLFFISVTVGCQVDRKFGNQTPKSHMTPEIQSAVMIQLNQRIHRECPVSQMRFLSLLIMLPASMETHEIFRAGDQWTEYLLFDICGVEFVYEIGFEMVSVGNATALSFEIKRGRPNALNPVEKKKNEPPPLPAKATRKSVPSGYEPVDLAEVRVRTIKPAAWYLNHDVANGGHAYFMTRENYKTAPDQQFQTGISINILLRQPKRGADFLQKLTDSSAEQMVTPEIRYFDKGPLRGSTITGEAKKYAQSARPIKMRQSTLLNLETGTIYVIVFEAPVVTWAESLKVALPVLETMELSPDI